MKSDFVQVQKTIICFVLLLYLTTEIGNC